MKSTPMKGTGPLWAVITAAAARTVITVALWSTFSTFCLASQVAGTDFVYLIDQSGSMSGAGVAKVENDPYGKRVQLLMTVIDHLQTSAQQGYVNRISVVEFGGRYAVDKEHRPQVTLSRLEIPVADGVTDAATVKRYIESAFATVDPQGFRGDTDTAAALALTLEELAFFQQHSVATTPAARQGKRETLVILVTDGAAYATQLNSRKGKAEIRRHVATINSQYPDATVAVFAINDGGSSYWKRGWGEFWRELASVNPADGQPWAFLLAESDSVIRTIKPMLTSLIAPKTATVTAQSYSAPPYLQAVNFAVDFQLPGLSPDDIHLYDPDGVRVRPTEVSTMGAAVRVEYPKAGRWQLAPAQTTNPALYQVHITPVYQVARLIQPRKSINQHTEVKLVFDVQGRGPTGKFEPIAGLPLPVFKAEVQKPDGTQQAVNLTWDEGKQQLIADSALTTDVVGDYQVTMEAKILSPSGERVVVLHTTEQFTASPAVPVRLRLERPLERLILTDGKLSQQPVAFTLINGKTAAAMDAATVLNKQPMALSVVADDSLPQHLRRALSQTTYPLSQDGTQLTTAIDLDFGGVQWQWLTSPGLIRLAVTPIDDSIANDGYTVVDIIGQTASGMSGYLTIAESPWSLRYWLSALLAGLLLAVLVGKRFLVPQWIAQSDRKAKRKPRLTIMFNGIEVAAEWSLSGIAKIKGEKHITLPGNQSWRIKDFKIKRYLQSGRQVKVKIWYREKNPTNGTHRKRVQVLAATDNNAADGARAFITGLPGTISAEFVLSAGTQG